MVLLKRSVPFLLAFVGVYLLVFWSLCRLTYHGTPLIYSTSPVLLMKGGDTYQRFREFDPDSTYDVLFIGSSHAYRGYDAAYFTRHGRSAFNLGSSAQTPMNSYFLLKDLVKPDHVGLVVMDVYVGALENVGLESTCDLAQNIPSERAVLGMALTLHDPRVLNVLTLRWLMRDRGPMYVDSTYRPGGGALRTDSLKQPPTFDLGRPLHLEPVQVRYLRKIIRYCAENHIPLVLSDHYAPHASDHERHAAYVRELACIIGPDGPPFIDKSYAHHLSDMDHFFDYNHLNAAGAEIFSADLLDELQRRGLLPPR